MFEFHGWATIRVQDEDLDCPARQELEAHAVTKLREAITRTADNVSLFEVRPAGNGLIVLYAHGLRNHRFRPVIDLFKWIAAELPHSYGLLYAHDDEALGQENEFRVWRLARGEIEERPDPFLSPYIPTVELPSQFDCDVLFRWFSLLDNLRVVDPDAVVEEFAENVSPEQRAFLQQLLDRLAET